MPARLRDLARALRQFDVEVEKPRSGSHWKARGHRDGQPVTYPIPAHNADHTEIGDEYVRGVCRAYGIELEAFLRVLRGR